MQNLNVLVVEDQHTMLKIIGAILKSMGIFEIDEAKNGEEAIRMIDSRKNYDLIISDWIMDPVTGYQLLKKVKSNSLLKDIPFIMISSESCIDNIKAAKDAGVNAYIIKPFRSLILKDRISKIFDI